MRLDFLQSHAWQVSLGRFLVLLLVAFCIGLLFDIQRYAILTALFAYSVWSLVNLYRIQSWLRSRQRRPPPEDRGVWSDVSEFVWRKLRTERSRKRRLVALLRAFREAAAALPDGVIVLSGRRGILWFNESAGRLLSLTAPRDRGRRIDEFLPSAAQAWVVNPPPHEPLTDITSAHDDAVRLSFRLIPYTHNQMLLVVRDVSALMRLEQVRRDFVANVSHELRTPLTVLHGYLDMLEPEDAPQLAPILADLRSQSRRMTQIVEDLLTLSHLEAQQQLPEERIAMRGMLNMLKREGDALSQGRHSVTIDLATNIDLFGSPDYLHSAFSNLVTNAVRYTAAGGCITIRWEAMPGGARFAVADTGYGIPIEHLPRITERFYRVSNSRSRETGGTGLGLAIVKHVLQLHQARLEIHSEVGVGSTFVCLFPQGRLVGGTGTDMPESEIAKR